LYSCLLVLTNFERDAVCPVLISLSLYYSMNVKEKPAHETNTKQYFYSFILNSWNQSLKVNSYNLLKTDFV